MRIKMREKMWQRDEMYCYYHLINNIKVLYLSLTLQETANSFFRRGCVWFV